MATHDYVLDNAAGAAFRADLNAALAAIVSQNSNLTEPATTYAYMWWADTTTGILKRRNAANSGWISVMSLATGLIIGTDVQAYDPDTAKTDVEQTWTQVQRTNELTDNDGSFDLDAGYLDFKCTPTGAITLTFTNIPATPLVQKGTIILVNSGGYNVTAHANTKVSSTMLAAISAAGTYQLAYRTSNGVVYVTSSGALA